MDNEFDVIVVGGGHAGIEAAHIAAKMGAKTLLLTLLVEQIGAASCNPAIGGLGKGHLVKEVDALGGLMGKLADECGIQFRTLNESKGPAVRGTRAQIDMDRYKIAARRELYATKNLSIAQQCVNELILEEISKDSIESKNADSIESKSANHSDCDISKDSIESKSAKYICKGVKTAIGAEFKAKCVILTTGTFLGGKIHLGEHTSTNGRVGEPASIELSSYLRKIAEILDIEIGRLKTGTCARIKASSIDFSDLEQHLGEDPAPCFSYKTAKTARDSMKSSESSADSIESIESIESKKSQKHPKLPQLPCFVSYTNEKTHEIIRANRHRAPMFSGQIQGVGPRYCPSIEDKVHRFADKERHQLFLEPQTAEANEYYINGLTSSLPHDIQSQMIHTIKGLENAEIVRFGYAIEYDFIQPQELFRTLECRKITNLFCAGQINGTTGYEEAAAQGILAGINAALKTQDSIKFRRDSIESKLDSIESKFAQKPQKAKNTAHAANQSSENTIFNYKSQMPRQIEFRRDEAYIGVMVDDLVSRGTKEPYRLFSSRAEYRLLLREDNAIFRLGDLAHALGLMSDSDFLEIQKDKKQIALGLEFLKTTQITPSAEVLRFLESINSQKLSDKTELITIVSRRDFSKNALLRLCEIAPNAPFADFSERANEQILIAAKYELYLEKSRAQISQMQKNMSAKIPPALDFSRISGLSLELREKLQKAQPKTLFEASQISGITPAALEVLQIQIALHLRQKFN